MKEHQHVITTWLMDKDIPTEEMMMKMLASHPSSCVISCKHMTLMDTLITQKKNIGGVLPKIAAFILRLLIY
jgi:hypothetical protein